LRVDVSRAEAMPGVLGVLVGSELPTPYGIIPWTPDETALAVSKVCYVGDGVAAVAAIDEDTAIAACEAIEVLYEPLPAYYDPEDALAGEHKINPFARRGNLSKDVVLEFGDVEQSLDDADVVIEGEYFFEGTTHG